MATDFGRPLCRFANAIAYDYNCTVTSLCKLACNNKFSDFVMIVVRVLSNFAKSLSHSLKL